MPVDVIDRVGQIAFNDQKNLGFGDRNNNPTETDVG